MRGHGLKCIMALRALKSEGDFAGYQLSGRETHGNNHHMIADVENGMVGARRCRGNDASGQIGNLDGLNGNRGLDGESAMGGSEHNL